MLMCKIMEAYFAQTFDQSQPIYVDLRRSTSIYVDLRRFTSIYVDLRRSTSIYVNNSGTK